MPATARLLGAYAAGLSTDLLTNVLLATRAPVIVCPAMHTEMWEHPAVRDNLATLRRRGVHVVEPDEGRLAGGDSARVVSPSPDRIVAEVDRVLGGGDLAGLHVVVSAGGTREPIDAVRVIANRSSGKQGYAIAAEALSRGAARHARVHRRSADPAGRRRLPVETAAADAGRRWCAWRRRPMSSSWPPRSPTSGRRSPESGKIKKDGGVPADRARADARHPRRARARSSRAGQTLVGFAAETADLLANAEGKLRRKNLDLIVANDVSAPGVGFQHDTNAVTLIRAGGATTTDRADRQARDRQRGSR